MYYLSKEERDALREDYREKEREIQRYIGVYLSGLVLVTGWIVGPQTKPILKMALDNYGYNIYALLILAVLNVLFTCFLIYKSIIIHELMQFTTYHSEPESGFKYWEVWRRSNYSVTKRVRSAYTILLGVLPILISFFIMIGVGYLLYSSSQALVDRLNELDLQGAIPNANSATLSSYASKSISAEQLNYVFSTAKIWFWAVVAIHVLPFWFFWENVVPTGNLWKKINRVRQPNIKYDDLDDDSQNNILEPSSGNVVVSEVSSKEVNSEDASIIESSNNPNTDLKHEDDKKSEPL